MRAVPTKLNGLPSARWQLLLCSLHICASGDPFTHIILRTSRSHLRWARTSLLLLPLKRAAIRPARGFVLQSFSGFERFSNIGLGGGIISGENWFRVCCWPLLERAGAYRNR